MNFVSVVFSLISLCLNVHISQPYKSHGTAKILYTFNRDCLWTKSGFKLNSIEQSPSSESNSHSDSQGIPRLLRNSKVHYCVHNSPPLVPILTKKHLVHTLPPYFPNSHSVSYSHLRLGLPSGLKTC